MCHGSNSGLYLLSNYTNMKNPKMIKEFNGVIPSGDDKFKPDRKDPWLRDIIVIAEKIFITDFGNSSVKVFDMEGKPLAKRVLTGPPNSITQVKPEVIAVTIPFDDDPAVQLLDIKDLEMTVQTCLQTQYTFRGIAKLDDSSMVVSTAWWNGLGRAFIISHDGTVVKSYGHPTEEKKALTQCATFLCCTKSGDIVLSDCNENCIVCLKPDGSIKYTCYGTKDEEFQLVVGVTCDSDGTVYVADEHKNNIFVISNDGKDVTLLFDNENDFDQPWGVHVEEKKLYVAERHGKIKIFDLSE
ncbi:hypothetical protein LOTGIDRAFT_232380 [Lottia gigantea]|uniref:SMP-30/Gluconolactonase/LRE-like region domain-containing protein n=1 Tax=Lottia gigantea TaxID=225164 RepID=V4ACK4_LOTGI|nr:hypothetical protein LOTGIDRAFT_232380 [Lottia gigantea]ESO94577.1 hypothetical protein LOTGIDRAFT_232380 [Lottia gigantea]